MTNEPRDSATCPINASASLLYTTINPADHRVPHSCIFTFSKSIPLSSLHQPNMNNITSPAQLARRSQFKMLGATIGGVRGTLIGGRLQGFLSKSDDTLILQQLKSAQLLKCGLAVRVTQNLEAVSMQLWVRVTSRSSSAWILAAPDVDDRAVFVEGLFLQNLFELVVLITSLFFVTSIWTENSEWTGLWSENLDSPLKYHICFSPSPFHKILSHLPTNVHPN